MVPGLYAAGNVTDPSQQVLQAAANGSRVGAMISSELADDDLRALARPSANEADWDHRYEGEQIWSGNPNGTLVIEIGGMTPGRALDVGAGEGGDALWLAEQGWQVTASDVSQRALDRIDAEARRRGLSVECHHADANALDAFETAAFDLVSAQYASIPRTPDGRGVRNILNAVAPGGTLLIVGHDLEAMHARIECARPRPCLSTQMPTYRLRTSLQRFPTHQNGTSKSTRSDLVRQVRHPLHITSKMSCCAHGADDVPPSGGEEILGLT